MENKLPHNTAIWHYRNFSEFVAILQNRALWFTRVDKLHDPWEGRSMMPDKPPEVADHEEKGLRQMCVSCWTIDEDDSDLMWMTYAPQSGVAIKSTAGRLRVSLLKTFIHLMEVPYGPLNTHDPFRKRSRFKREREYRVVDIRRCESDGVLWNVDLEKLIDEIWVSPYAPRWFGDVVKNLLNQYGLTMIKVVHKRFDGGEVNDSRSAD